MAEYEMPIEEQVSLLVKKFGSFERRLDSIDTKLESIETKVESIDTRVDSIDAKVNSIDARVKTVETIVSETAIRLDQTHDVAKLGLEAVEGLRESMERRSDAMKELIQSDHNLLTAVMVHVRKRVERVEQPKGRRGRS